MGLKDFHVNEWLGADLPNHLRDFYEGIKIRALFSWAQCEPCVVCKKGGLEVEWGISQGGNLVW